MTVATILSRASVGVHAQSVSIETHLSPGLPAFHLIGLPETAVRERKTARARQLLIPVTNFRPAALPSTLPRRPTQARHPV